MYVLAAPVHHHDPTSFVQHHPQFHCDVGDFAQPRRSEELLRQIAAFDKRRSGLSLSDESLPLTTAADEAFCLPEEALPLTTDEAVGIPDQLLRLTMANNNTTSESTISNVQ